MSAVVLTVPELRWATPADRVTAAITAHLAPAHVTAQYGAALTLTVTGATPTDVALAADLYLGGAGITFELRSAAA